MNKKGVSRFPVGNSLPHSAELFRREPFTVSETLGYRNVSCILGGYHGFPSKIFSLTVLQIFVGESFCVSENFRYGKQKEKEGSITTICQQFLSHTSENFVGRPFSVSLFPSIGNFYTQEVFITISCQIFTDSQCRKFPWRNPSMFQKDWGSKKFMQNGGLSRFPSNVFRLTVRKDFVGEHFCVSENVWYGKKT